MGERLLMKGAEAIAEAAIRAGAQIFFGYPITPQNETPEYFSRRMPELGRKYVQAESEVASINMVYGAASTGTRVITSSSSPGISLMQEGFSYIGNSNVPCVVVNVMRGGPGLGNIAPAQADYFQATKGGGHGDYHSIVLAPHTVQEQCDLMYDAFELAEKYRIMVVVLSDGLLGQMMEPVEFRDWVDVSKFKTPDWAIVGKGDRQRNLISSFDLEPEGLEKMNLALQEKYKKIAENETRYELFMMDDAEYALTGFGTVARIMKTTVKMLREKGIKAGLIRPITVWPFPYKVYEEFADKVKFFFDVEMNEGQMLEDVKLGVNGKKPVQFYGRFGGVVPTAEEIYKAFRLHLGGC
ncbi:MULTISPECIES: 3-methyl-2-oxobutanoate dehydrogenase subunit VorB [Caldisericum]|jgi:2-oxoglutarate ferredoxin oxidoreductase subunit alpha|uniref:3-methyl-2-oxobutanoate dehydrogenase subunit VorB n=1 Tax=Caldisericum TaxID=693074 RepID=UPI0039FD0E9E